MCLIFIAHHHHPQFPLVIAANRDEFYARDTAPMHFWKDMPDILAGKDLVGGGSWMGVRKNGRWAALTNYREPGVQDPNARSRGHLITDFLNSRLSPMEYLATVHDQGDQYNGFNLFAGNGESLAYCSNRGRAPMLLTPGIYGASNHFLDTPWPKLVKGKRRFASLLETPEPDMEGLLGMLTDTRRPPDERLPDTGVGIEWERLLSPVFITSSVYGTRCSTVVQMGSTGEVEVVERSYEINAGHIAGHEDRRYTFSTVSR